MIDILPLAYLDPGMGSIVLQAVIGIILGAGVVFRQSLYQVGSFLKKPFKRSDSNGGEL